MYSIKSWAIQSTGFRIDDDDVKIVEYNCINCSGLYHSDISEMIHRLSAMR